MYYVKQHFGLFLCGLAVTTWLSAFYQSPSVPVGAGVVLTLVASAALGTRYFRQIVGWDKVPKE